MELHPLSLPLLAAQGQARSIADPRPPAASLEEAIQRVLTEGRQRMEYEEAVEDWLHGRPVRALRHPRKSLRCWLFGKPEPVPPLTCMSSVEPVWMDGR